MEPEYLGDGVYVTINPHEPGLILTTACHYGCVEQQPVDTIYLEPTVVIALHNYITKIRHSHV